jgi:hypothetical protein
MHTDMGTRGWGDTRRGHGDAGIGRRGEGVTRGHGEGREQAERRSGTATPRNSTTR